MKQNRHWDGIEAMARSKRARRQALANLPFEQKIRILLELQKTAAEIRSAMAGKMKVA